MDYRPAPLITRENLPFGQCYFLSRMIIYISSQQESVGITSPKNSVIIKKTLLFIIARGVNYNVLQKNET